MSTTVWFLRSAYLSERISATDRFVALVASAAHDVAHPGKNNMFLVKTMAPLAVRYNDKSVLENMHAALTFETMLQDSECDWFSLLRESGEVAAGTADNPAAAAEPAGASSQRRTSGTSLSNLQQYLRKGIISLVLATDMVKHSQHVKALVDFVVEVSSEDGDTCSLLGKQKALERTLFLLETVLHASDISNPCKPWQMSLAWTKRLLTEFWAQGDEERKIGLEISPLCDRESGQKAVPKGQIGFISFVVQPLYKPIVEFIPEAREALDLLDRNKACWEEKEQEETPFEDIFPD
jgi:hypothetical protein